jgi:hypothetical protein
MPILPTDAAERKKLPVATGVLDYFPKALLEVSKASIAGNNQFMPGEPLRWDRTKSVDDADALARHFLERGTFDSDGVRHSAKCAWRALAILEKELDAEENEVLTVKSSYEKRSSYQRRSEVQVYPLPGVG